MNVDQRLADMKRIFETMSPAARLAVYKDLKEKVVAERARNQIGIYYPDEGPLRRGLYTKHLEFFSATLFYNEVLFIAANRSGKTHAVCYAAALHMTGKYPKWWVGRRFDRPVTIWFAGEDAKAVRESLQEKLLGRSGNYGTGLIPGDSLVDVRTRAGVADTIDVFSVKHVSGGKSRGVFKAYEQGRESFQSAAVDIIILDEEPPQPIYSEALTRTLSTKPGQPNGLIMASFTPLKGLSEVVLNFLPGGKMPQSKEERVAAWGSTRFVVQASWMDVPHITKEAADALMAGYLPNERAARTQGIPSMGAGQIYPVPEEDFVCEPFQLPAWYEFAFAMDVGWKKTAVVWGARDPETDVLYIWSEHYQGEEKPVVHAEAIRRRGDWIPGVIDPAAGGRSQVDGEKLMELYTDLGLELTRANNAVSAGIYEVWTRLSTGRLKVFHSCVNLLFEMRLYRRDEKGKIVKENDHAVDACLDGDTRVVTDRGLIEIRDLVGTEGRAMTRNGAWARWSTVRKTRSNAKVIRLFFHTGEVICTPDHRFLTPEGWVRADCMEGKLCYNGVAQSVQTKSWNPLKSLRRRAKSSWEHVTTYVGSIFNGTACVCTVKFGNSPMDAMSPMGSTSIIRTTIGPTMSRGTSNSSRGRIMRAITTSAIADLYLGLLWMLRRNGMLPRRVSSGTGNITPMSLSNFIDELHGPATIAGANTKPSSPRRIGFVRTLARRALASRAALTTCNVVAWFVARVSWSIATFGKPLALDRALIRCVGIQEWPDEDVYCMDMPGVSAFVIEGGMVVHNCRYLCMSGLDKAKQTPPSLVAAGRVRHSVTYDPMGEFYKGS